MSLVSVLRTTVLIDAPVTTVSGAFIEQPTLRGALASAGIRRVVGPRHRVLAPGEALRVSSPFRLLFTVDSVRADGMTATLAGGPLASGEFSARCAATAAGTLLTCTLAWRSRGAALGRLADVVLFRRFVLRVLDAMTRAVDTRARRLSHARVVVAAAIVRDRRLLAQQRAFPAADAGLWELAGGRVEDGETDMQALRRECKEELDVHIEPTGTLGPDVMLGDDLLLRAYRCDIAEDARPAAREHRQVRWLAANDLDTVPWLPADRVFLPALRDLLG